MGHFKETHLAHFQGRNPELIAISQWHKSSQPLLQIVAPAYWGKSALLHQWLHRYSQQQLGQAQMVPAMVVDLEQHKLHFGETVLQMLGQLFPILENQLGRLARQNPDVSTLFTKLVGEVLKEHPVLLALDGYDTYRRNRGASGENDGVLLLLGPLLKQSPCRVLLTSREALLEGEVLALESSIEPGAFRQLLTDTALDALGLVGKASQAVQQVLAHKLRGQPFAVFHLHNFLRENPMALSDLIAQPDLINAILERPARTAQLNTL